ncbi:uncharacterized protein LOC126749609 [Anthonomus grandis grandis]|uniref:uncharacterized protein LOC126749609 n=1 Tax=Anthonomus grandis grandis TaxID=2921223 RepID=UPI0021656D49|nr:uncharacterized protein LOC126749609 [Anthonomus grandis grandis]
MQENNSSASGGFDQQQLDQYANLEAQQEQLRQLKQQIQQLMQQQAPGQQDYEGGSVTATSYKLKEFEIQYPEAWFAKAELEFQKHRTTSDSSKFHEIVCALPSNIVEQLLDIIYTPPAQDKYATLKARILKRYADPEVKKLEILLSGVELGDRKPSELFRYMQNLAKGNVSDLYLLTHWLSLLPANIRPILKALKTDNVDKTLEAADSIIDTPKAPYTFAIGTPTHASASLTPPVAAVQRTSEFVTKIHSASPGLRTEITGTTEHLRVVLDILLTNKLRINWDKCVFAQEEINFLGFTVNARGFKPPAEKVEAILAYPRPETLWDLKRYLGAVNYFRAHMPHAAHSQVLLNDQLRGSRKRDKRRIEWTPQLIEAFESTRKALADATSSSFLNPDAKIGLTADASSTAIGGSLEQIIGEARHPLGFFSRKLSPTE